MNNFKDEKKELRHTCTAIRNGIPMAEKAAADEKILRYVSQLISYRYADLLLFYAPIKSEVDVMPLLLDALEKGRRVALPLCESEPGIMTYREIRSTADLHEGAFGVREPSGDAPVISKEELLCKNVFAFVPALAFDKEGYRLGYGKGYYDRFLSNFGGVSAGIVYSELIYDKLPKGFFDRKVDLLVCERGVIRIHD